MDPNSKAPSPPTSDPETASEKHLPSDHEKIAIYKQQNPDDRRNSEAILEAIKHKKQIGRASCRERVSRLV